MGKNKFIKITAFTLSLLLVWQSIIWADPDITQRNNFNPGEMTLAPALFGDKVQFFGQYLLGRILKLEQRDIHSMRGSIEREILELLAREDIPQEVREELIGLSSRLEETGTNLPRGAFTVDLSALGFGAVRFYGSERFSVPDGPWSIKEGSETKLAEYLYRQELSRDELPRSPDKDDGDEFSPPGFIAKGDDNELFAVFKEKALTGEISGELKSRFSGLIEGLRERVDRSELDVEIKERLLDAISRAANAGFLSFYVKTEKGSGHGALVLPDDKDGTKAKGWLLGFNTIIIEGDMQEEPSRTLSRRLRNEFDGRDILGLSTRVIEIAGRDDLILQEYLLHKIICSYFGHEKSREIQEELMPENYKGILGDKRTGHRDGELSIVLKKAISEQVDAPSDDLLDRVQLDREYSEFRKKDFTRGEDLTWIETFRKHYEKYFNYNIGLAMWSQSRLSTPADGITSSEWRNIARDDIRKLNEQYDHIKLRIMWIWKMQSLWKDIENIVIARNGEIGSRNREYEEVIKPGAVLTVKDLNALFKEGDIRTIRVIARRLVVTHVNFIKDNRGAVFLNSDSHVIGILSSLVKLVEIKSAEDDAIDVTSFSDSGEGVQTATIDPTETETGGLADGYISQEDDADGKDPEHEALMEELVDSLTHPNGNRNKERTVEEVYIARTAKKELPAKRTSGGVNFKELFKVLLASTALSGILYLILPVTEVTSIIGTVVPLALLIYLLVRNWSLKNLLITVGLSIILSVLMPFPWIGLSIALIIMTRMVIDRGKGPQARSMGPTGTKGQISDKRGNEVQEDRILRLPNKERGEDNSMELELSADIWNKMSEILELVVPPQEEQEVIEGKEGVSAAEKIPNTRTVLDAFFRLADQAEEIVTNDELKNVLRPLVNKRLSAIEDGYEYSLQRTLGVLSNWQNEDDEELAKAIQETAGEVSISLASRAKGDESRKEMLAVKELIAEYYGIDEAKFQSILQRLILDILRDDVKEKSLLSQATAKDYYALGRAEFWWSNGHKAEEAFAEAVGLTDAKETIKKEYWLTLGIVRHYIESWAKAERSYKPAISLRTRDDAIKSKEEVQKKISRLKKELTELLLEKAKNKVNLWEEKKGKKPDQQIGKEYTEVRITGLKENKLNINVVGSESGESSELVLYGASQEPVSASQRDRVLDAIRPEDRTLAPEYRSLIEKILSNFPDNVSLFVFDNLEGDLFGLASRGKHLIALFSEIADDPVALFHEIGEYLLVRRSPVTGQFLLDLRFDEGILHVSIDGEAKDPVVLSQRTLDSIQNESWENGWQSDQHYLLRVLQREIFGDNDISLSIKIESEKDIAAIVDKHSSNIRDWIELNREEFEAHRDKARAFISKGAEGLGGTAVIFAPGELEPLEDLARNFDEVILIGIDGKVLWEARESAGTALAAKIKIKKEDLSGIFRELVNKGNALIASGLDRDKALAEMTDFINNYNFQDFGFDQYGANYIVSSLLTSQLYAFIERYIRDKFLTAHKGISVSYEIRKEFEEALVSLEKKLQISHIQGLNRWINDDGRIAFLDTFYSYGIDDMSQLLSIHSPPLNALLFEESQREIRELFEASDEGLWDWLQLKPGQIGRWGGGFKVKGILLSKEIASPAIGFDGLLSNAEEAIDILVQNLIGLATNKEGERIVLAIDLDIGESQVQSMFNEMIKRIRFIKHNNNDLEVLLDNLVIRSGRGESLAASLTSDVNIKPENIIVIAKDSNIEHFEGLFQATVAGINVDGFEDTDYLPLVNVILFAIGKHLNWKKEVLAEFYNLIPGVLSLDNLMTLESENPLERIEAVLGVNSKIFIIKLIPNATALDEGEHTRLNERVNYLLAQA